MLMIIKISLTSGKSDYVCMKCFYSVSSLLICLEEHCLAVKLQNWSVDDDFFFIFGMMYSMLAWLQVVVATVFTNFKNTKVLCTKKLQNIQGKMAPLRVLLKDF